MITFTILVVAILALIIAATLIVLAGGVGFVLAFGDLIVCGLIIGLIIRLFAQRK